jgi:tRNA-binding EMAP/Myf-like protein
MSNGMVLCASNADHSKVEILRPPEGSKVGERVRILGQESLFKDEPEPVLNPKKK